MSPAWMFALGRLIGALGVAVAGGLIFGRIDLWLLIVLATYLVLQLANLYRVWRWLRHRNEESPPDIGGIWGDLIALIGRIHRRKKFHKRRILLLLREIRRLTAALPEGVILLSREREIIWFNRTAARMLGLRRKLDFGMRIENLLRQPEFTRYLSAGQFAAPVVVRWSRPQERFMACHLTAAGAQQLLLVRDVTREMRIEAMRKDFVANASHELRSPLTVISGYLGQLADDPAIAGAWREPVGEMQRQAERMRLIVEDLLELSRLEASGEEAPREPVDVAALIERVRAECTAGDIGRRTIDLRVDSRARLLGSAQELHSVVANLVSNATKYTAADGAIQVRWWTDARGGHLSVTDNGTGIAAEHLPRLTERFYRVDHGRSRDAGGSGLGLAIVKHGLQRHGGRLAIESVEGQGSIFTCRFPPSRVVPEERAAAAGAG